MCDVHLSEQEWLENHINGEKHGWVEGRVALLLPVQWALLPPQVVPRPPPLPPELLCCLCCQVFPSHEKYRRHLASLHHLKRCAGEGE